MAGQMQRKAFSYNDLMKVHSDNLKTPDAGQARMFLVNKAYAEVFGRVATMSELNYWRDTIEADGTPYNQVLAAAVAWIIGGKPEQDKDLREMIKRAFTANKKSEPNGDKYNYWMGVVKAKHLYYIFLVPELKNKL